VATKLRATRSSVRSVSAPSPNVVLRVFSRDSRQPLGFHQPLHRTARDLNAFAVEFGVDLAGAVDTEVGLVSHPDVFAQFGIPHPARRGSPGVGGVVGAQGDLRAGVLQDGADRLDPEPVTVLVDVVDQYRGGHSYLILRLSSAAAKEAADVFRISFARRSSRTSRSNSTSRPASSVM